MAKSHAAAEAPERYEDIVKRLDEVVAKLESGQLSLEDSLQAFEEGVGLVRRGEARLGEAEKRVELLLNEAGDSRAPFDAEKSKAEAPQVEAVRPQATERRPARPNDDDVPF